MPPDALGSTRIGSTTYVFVPSEAGASTQFATLYAQTGATLEVVRLGNEDFRVAFGGSVAHGNGARCDGETLVLLNAESSDGKTWTLSETRYSLEGPRATLISEGVPHTIADSSGAKVAPYYTITCDGVVSLSD